jgi:hypothetical protein
LNIESKFASFFKTDKLNWIRVTLNIPI